MSTYNMYNSGGKEKFSFSQWALNFSIKLPSAKASSNSSAGVTGPVVWNLSTCSRLTPFTRRTVTPGFGDPCFFFQRKWNAKLEGLKILGTPPRKILRYIDIYGSNKIETSHKNTSNETKNPNHSWPSRFTMAFDEHFGWDSVLIM